MLVGCGSVLAIILGVVFSLASLGKAGHGEMGGSFILGCLALACFGAVYAARLSKKRKAEATALQTQLAAAQAAEAARLETERRWRALVDTFGFDAATRIASGQIWRGATEAMVHAMHGAPEEVSKKVLKTKQTATWRYFPITANRYALKVHFENGECVGWDEN